MLSVEVFRKRAVAERFDNLTQTSGESVQELAERLLEEARKAIETTCKKYGGYYSDDPLVENAVYIYAVGLLYAANQLSQGADELVRAEKEIEKYFYSSPGNPYAKTKVTTVAGCRVDLHEVPDCEEFWRNR